MMFLKHVITPKLLCRKTVVCRVKTSSDENKNVKKNRTTFILMLKKKTVMTLTNLELFALTSINVTYKLTLSAF